MSADDRPILLAIQHVPWEGPHRILDACGGLDVHTVKPLAGQALPDHDEVAGAVVMGGPMNVDEVDAHPELASEREWLAEAVRREMPVLGICLGAQLLARALGAEVRPGEGPELGYAPVEILDPDDPILGALAPSTTVLHWHGDVFDLPDGAEHLARSERRPRSRPSATATPGASSSTPSPTSPCWRPGWPCPRWSTRPAQALGDDGAAALPAQAEAAEADLLARTTPGLEAFAALVESHRPS